MDPDEQWNGPAAPVDFEQLNVFAMLFFSIINYGEILDFCSEKKFLLLCGLMTVEKKWPKETAAIVNFNKFAGYKCA